MEVDIKNSLTIRNKHLLVVEDLEPNQLLLVRMLEIDDHLVETAENGAEAIDAVLHAFARAKPLDVIIMDIQMPIMNGIEATRKIRQLAEEVRSVPIIALTANAVADTERRCREVGMDAFMTKPVDRQKLREKITEVLAGASQCGAPD